MDELFELGYIHHKIIEFNESSPEVSEFELTPDGLLYADELIDNIPLERLTQIEEMIHIHGYKELDSLLHDVYSDYPEYTENSVTKDRVFNLSEIK